MNGFKLKYDHITGLKKHQSGRNRGFGGILGPFGRVYLSQFSSDFKNSNGFGKWASLSTIWPQNCLFLMKFKIWEFRAPNLDPISQ